MQRHAFAGNVLSSSEATMSAAVLSVALEVGMAGKWNECERSPEVGWRGVGRSSSGQESTVIRPSERS